MNNSTSNTYCHDSGKAIINYRPYSQGKIRYRYSNQDWFEKKGESYELDYTPPGQEASFSWYFIECEATVNGRFPSDEKLPVVFVNGQTIKCRVNASFPGIFADSIAVNDTLYSYISLDFKFIQSSSSNNSGQYENTNCYYRDISWQLISYEPDVKKALYSTPSTRNNIGVTNIRNFVLVENTSRNPRVCKPKPGKCTFRVFHCDELSFEATSTVCPEVEQIESSLGDEQSITVNSIPKDYHILVSSVGYSISGSKPPTMLQTSIPDHCLNIYKVNSSFFNPSANSNNTESPLQLIKQICSAKCSPPPEIEVTCLPPEKCPPGTCAVECNGHICCYDINGISVFNFPQ